MNMKKCLFTCLFVWSIVISLISPLWAAERVRPSTVIDVRRFYATGRVDVSALKPMIETFRPPQISPICHEEDQWLPIYRAIEKEFRAIAKENKDNEMQGLAALYQFLVNLDIQGDLTLLLPTYEAFFGYPSWDPHEMEKGVAWLDAQSSGTTSPGFAQDLKLFMQLYSARKHGRSSKYSLDKIKNELWDVFEHRLNDNQLSLPWRIVSTERLIDLVGQIPESLLIRSVHRLVQSRQAGQFLPPEYYHQTLQQFVECERDTSWCHLAKALNETYFDVDTHALLVPPHACPHVDVPLSVRMRTPPFTALKEESRALLDINLYFKQYSQAETIVNTWTPCLGHNLDAWALLVKYNQRSLVQSLIKTFQYKLLDRLQQPLSDTDVIQLDECLEGLSEDLAYYAKVRFAGFNYPERVPWQPDGNLYDPNNPKVQLAEQFYEVSFSDQAMRKWTLAHFCDDSSLPILPIMNEALVQATNDINISALQTSSQKTLADDIDQNLFLARLKGQLMVGDANDYIQALNELGNPQTGTDLSRWIRSSQTLRFFFMIPKLLEGRLTSLDLSGQSLCLHWTPQQMSGLAKANLALLMNTPESFQRYVQPSHALPIQYILAGQYHEFLTDFSKLPQHWQEQLRPYMTPKRLEASVLHLLRHNDNLKPDEALKIYALLEQLPDSFQNTFQESTHLKNPNDTNNLIRNEAMAWEELAMQQTHYKHYEQAAKSWLKSIERSQNKYDRWERQIVYIEFLRERNKYQEARDYIETIDTQGWPDRLLNDLKKQKTIIK